MNNETNTENMINDYINLKALIIESLRKQGSKENWTYPTLKNLNFTIKDKVYKSK